MVVAFSDNESNSVISMLTISSTDDVSALMQYHVVLAVLFWLVY